MTLAVVDASVLAVFYLSDDPRRDDVVARLAGGDALYAPAHLDAEVVSALRGLARVSRTVERVAPAALRHLAGLPIRRMPLAPLLERMWELRANVTRTSRRTSPSLSSSTRRSSRAIRSWRWPRQAEHAAPST